MVGAGDLNPEPYRIEVGVRLVSDLPKERFLSKQCVRSSRVDGMVTRATNLGLLQDLERSDKRESG